MFLLGNPLWTVTGAGSPTPPPTPPEETPPPRGRAAWLTDLPGARERSAEEVRRDRQRFGVLPPDALEAIADVALQQALRSEQDEQKRFDELYRELELRRIAFDARYLEALNAMREQAVLEARAIQRRQREEDDLVILMLLAAAAAEVR